MPIDPMEGFLGRFIVRIDNPARPEEPWGTGVLLGPQVVATCRHLMMGLDDARAWVRLADVGVGATMVTWPDDGHERRIDPDQDVGFLLLDDPLGSPHCSYPALIRGMSSSAHRRLEAVLAAEPDMLMSCGHQRGGPKLTRASIDSVTFDREGLVDWMRLCQSHRKGESGGPIWLIPPEPLPERAAPWRPGLVVGLVAQGARDEAPGRTPSGGPPHSFAVTSDTLLALRDALCEAGGLPKARCRDLGELRTLPAGKVVDWAELPLDDVVTPAELQEYLRKAESLHKELPLVGFETETNVPILLHDLYVPLDAMTAASLEPFRGSSVEETEAAALEHEARGYGDRLPLAEAFTMARARGQRGVVLLGNPGSGKTTHLEHVLLELERNGPHSLGLPPGTVPVFLTLRNLGTRDMAELIQRELRTALGGPRTGFGARLCKRGRLLFLLDGLDEVADPKQRAMVARWIDDVRRSDETNFFLVSCRFTGYTPDVRLGPGFLELHLRPFDDEQARMFVRSWYRAVEPIGTRDPVRAEERAQRAAEALIERLEQLVTPRLYSLTHNPLLLSVICLVHRRRGGLPEERWLLYHEVVQVLLERWRKLTHRLEVPFSTAEAWKVLESLAWWMHDQPGRTHANQQALVGPVTEALERAELASVSAERFLTVIRDASGVLAGWNGDTFGFVCTCLQEHLAAQAIRARASEEPALLERLAERLGDGWWQEVILLTLMQDEPALFVRFMEALVRQPEAPKWADARLPEDPVAMFGRRGKLGARERGVWPHARWGPPRLASSRFEQLERQLSAMDVIEDELPQLFAELKRALPRHPSQTVRAWWLAWRERRRRQELLAALVPVRRTPWIEHEQARTGDDPRPAGAPASVLLARYPVTNEQFTEYLAANPAAPKPRFWAYEEYNQPRQPVVGVSWREASAYCKWAGLSLPTESEWEHACRAGSTTQYSLGDHEQDLARAGWYGDNSGGRLHAVGEKEPNDFGLFDMHGNVYEWCSADRAPEDRPGDEPACVIRGGSFRSPAHHARSGHRFAYPPEVRGLLVGFRPCVRWVSPSPLQ